MQYWVLSFFFALVAGCSKGSLYLGRDGSDYRYPQVDMDGFPTSGSLDLLYGSNFDLFYGSRKDYHELLFVYFGAGQKPEKLERYIFRQVAPLNIVEIALQAEQTFDPLHAAECSVKIKANLVKKDFCEGSSTCMRFEEQEISSKDADTCGWPRMRDFIVKVEGNGNIGYVTEPGQEAWTKIEKINFAGVSSVPLQISETEASYTSVVGTATADGYVVAGKLEQTNKISASYVTLADGNAEPDAKDKITKVPLIDSVGDPYADRAASRNVLLVITPDGFYRLNDHQLWEKLTLPTGMSAMPSGKPWLESASGVAQAAFRFILQESGVSKNLIVLYTETDATLKVVDASTLDISTGLEEWSIHLINGELWIWNPALPALAKKFVQAENKWLPLTLEIPDPQESESISHYQLSGTGGGFVLSTTYEKEVIPGPDAGPVIRKIFRHYYYNQLSEYSGNYVDTYGPPEALHFQDAKMYAERVVGMFDNESKVLNYGYIYDFLEQKGRLFQDELLASRSERLTKFSGLIVSDRALFFYGGCEKPVNRLCLPTSSSARLVKFKNGFDPL